MNKLYLTIEFFDQLGQVIFDRTLEFCTRDDIYMNIYRKQGELHDRNIFYCILHLIAHIFIYKTLYIDRRKTE